MAPRGSRSTDRKRQRATSSAPSHEDEHEATPSDCDAAGDDATRPGQAERKRELERNRRNLVNVRFAELEAELARRAPRADPAGRLTRSQEDGEKPGPMKGKRIDKEAVLKEAASRLANQRADLVTAAERMNAMTAEIENLRAEKVELRNDKNYLRNELETVRRDCGQLRIDNIGLWEAFRGASTLKGGFSADVAKIPADLFSRTGNLGSEQLANTNIDASAVQTVARTPNIRALQPSQQGSPSPVKNTLPQAVVQTQQQSQQSQQQSHPQQPVARSDQVSNNAQANAMDAAMSTLLPSSLGNPVNESYLMLQTPEDLGALFSNYVPGAMVACLQNATQPLSRVEAMQNAANPRSATGEEANQSTGAGLPGPPLRSNSQGPPAIDSQPSGTSGKADEEDDNLLSDIAYCV